LPAFEPSCRDSTEDETTDVRQVSHSASLRVRHHAGVEEVGFFLLGMPQSFLYGGGLPGYFPLLLAFFGGPWLAAWITCKILPSQRRRMIARLIQGHSELPRGAQEAL